MRNDILQQAQAIRDGMNKVTATLSDEQALEVKELYPLWEIGVLYTANTSVVRYGEKLYRCLQSHTGYSDIDSPTSAPALWVEIAAPNEYREIKDNMPPTEAFDYDEVGWYKTKDSLWQSKLEANTYTPVTYPNGWVEFTG